MSRIILHADLDCFYCQVEQKRLGISIDIPAAVQQWNGLIAVNYAAREKGVKRHSTVQEARALCPELVLMHVATFSIQNEGITDLNHSYKASYYDNPSPKTHKVSLEPYRNASSSIFKILRSFCSIVEKASVDEAYLDITDIVHSRLEASNSFYRNFMAVCDQNVLKDELEKLILTNFEQNSLPVSNNYPALDWTGLGRINEEADSFISDFHYIAVLRLHRGALLAQEIRRKIYEELGYTCSVGISHCKTLSKICSAYKKPNQQTCMLPSDLNNFLKDFPLSKIRFLGGKLGSLLSASSLLEHPQTAGDLRKWTVADIQKAVDDRESAAWIFNIVRGIDHSVVEPKGGAKSLLSAKSLRPSILSLKDLRKWIEILSSELVGRIENEAECTNRYPKTLSITYSTDSVKKSKSRNFEFTIPLLKLSIEGLSSFVEEKLALEKDALFPCQRISVSVSNFSNMEKFSSTMDAFLIKTNVPLDDTPQPKPISSQFTVKNEKRKNVLDSWIKSVKSKGDAVKCSKCGSWIINEPNQLQEHDDFHFAMNLSQ